MPARIESSVVLPAPLGPITATSGEGDAPKRDPIAEPLDEVPRGDRRGGGGLHRAHIGRIARGEAPLRWRRGGRDRAADAGRAPARPAGPAPPRLRRRE